MEYDYHAIGSSGDFKISFSDKKGEQGSVNGKEYSLDVLETNTGYHIIKDGKGSNVDVISIDRDKRIVQLRVNGKRYEFKVKDKYEELLEKLGMDISAAGKVSEIKAPMPGLVLDIMVDEGVDVQQDQPLMILEAMKMENVIKSPSEGKVKKISVTKGDSVEKNEVMIHFD